MEKLNILMVVQFNFRLESIFKTAPAASKNNAQFKTGQKQNPPLKYL